MSAQPCRVPHPNTGRQGAAAPVPSRHPSPHMPLFTLPTHPTPNTPLPRVWQVGEVPSAPRELSRTSKARKGDRTNRCGTGVGGGWGAWARRRSKKDQKQNQQNTRREMIRSSSRLFYLPGGTPDTWLVGTIGLPFFLLQLSMQALGKRRGGRGRSLSLRVPLRRAWTPGEASLQHTKLMFFPSVEVRGVPKPMTEINCSALLDEQKKLLIF